MTPAGTTSAESHAAQRALAKERKASKPNADMIERLKKIWERLRRQSHVPLEERKQLVTELFDMITGNIRDLVFKHDSVRVVQCGLKYANKTQRLQVAQELQGDIRALAESKYGKFLVAKLIVEGDDQIRAMIIPAFYGHVRRLINHPEAAWIMDDIYRQVANTKQKAMLLREWYSAEFAIMAKSNEPATAEPTADLATILKGSPEKKRTMMQYLQQLINQLIQKKMTAFTMLHDAMLQYLLNTTTDGEEAKEFLELLKSDLNDDTTTSTNPAGGDLLKSLAFTTSGARVVRLALAYGSAKDRKTILKVYKDIVVTMAQDTNAQSVLLAAMDVTDDTKLSAKALFSDLLCESMSDETAKSNALLDLLLDKRARVVLLYPLAGATKAFLTPQAFTAMTEVHEIRTTTSKKDPETRRQELIKYISPTLLSFVTSRAKELSESIERPQAITEILIECHGEKGTACSAVAELCAGDPNEETHIAHSSASGKMLKTLIQGGKFDLATKKVQVVDPPLGFADVIFETIKPNLVQWAMGPSATVIAALLESSQTSKENKSASRKTLIKNRKAIEKAAVSEPVKTSEDASKKDKKAKKQPEQKGNRGAKVLLEMLDA